MLALPTRWTKAFSATSGAIRSATSSSSVAVVLASLPFYFASLDLPRRIVNEAIQGTAFERRQHDRAVSSSSRLALPDWLGGGSMSSSSTASRSAASTCSSACRALFLFFVLINGAFKYWINVAKGALGERMLRRMRFDLFALRPALHARGPAHRQVLGDRDHHQGRGRADRRLHRRRLHHAGLPRHPGR